MFSAWLQTPNNRFYDQDWVSKVGYFSAHPYAYIFMCTHTHPYTLPSHTQGGAKVDIPYYMLLICFCAHITVYLLLHTLVYIANI